MKKFKVIFYEDSRGRKPVLDWVRSIRELVNKGDKSARVLYNVIDNKIKLLEKRGTRASDGRVNELVWEIRCKNSRILFGQHGNCLVLLHYII